MSSFRPGECHLADFRAMDSSRSSSREVGSFPSSGRMVAHPEITQEETLETETAALFQDRYP